MKKFVYILIGALLICLAGSAIRFKNLSNDLQNYEHNLNVSRDSIRTLILKNGEQLVTIGSYILEKKDLQKYLDISKSEIKELERKLGKISYISNIQSVTVFDSIYIKDTITVTPENIIKYNITYSDEWLRINGGGIIEGNYASTYFDSIAISTPLTVGLTDDYRIWVKSSNPYINITNIGGAVVQGSRLNQKQKRFGFGLSAGFGLQYGIQNKKIDYGPYVGIGITYKLW
jgi:hypothetical protein